MYQKFLSLLGATFIIGVSAADAISVRHDISEQAYIDLAKPYNSVGRASGNGSIGTGFLISSTSFATAAHLVDSNRDGIVDTSTYTVRLSQTGSGFSDIFTAASVIVHPLYSTNIRYDIAIFTFSSVIAGYTPMKLNYDNPIGTVGTMVGYGVHGTGDNLVVSSANVDNVRRAAQNTIDTSNSQFLLTDFDRVTENTSTYGSATPLALEGTSVAGDSGGPLIVGGGVVGLVQGGYSNLFAGFGLSEYGDRATWVRVDDPDNRAFLELYGAAELGADAIPEPSITLLGLVSCLLMQRRRCRA